MTGEAKNFAGASFLGSSNFRAWDSDVAQKQYHSAEGLFDGEKVLFERFRKEICNKHLLDLGIGTGRTTPHLMKMTDYYSGIDYSPAMVGRARERFPSADIRCCDVRDLRCFPSENFDFVCFSFNGLDYIPHEDRLRALREVFRVMRGGGAFLFSSHNLHWKDVGKHPWQREPIRSLRSIKNTLRAFAYLPRHWRLRRQNVQGAGWSFRNDSTLLYSIFTYYVDMSTQVSQLIETGFRDSMCFNVDGVPLVKEDPESPWLYFAARR